MWNKLTNMKFIRISQQDDIASLAKSKGYNIGPIYHGSHLDDIYIFDPNKAGTIRASDWGKGTYFTPSKGGADNYRIDAVKKTDLEDQRLWDEMEEEAKRLGTTPMMAGLDLGRNSEEYRRLQEFDKRWLKHRRELDKTKKGKVYSVFLKIKNPYFYVYQGITDPYLSDLAIGRGHDAVIVTKEGARSNEEAFTNAEEVLVFSPSQIKSADPITYDDNGNPIPMELRFDESKDDIRY